MTRTRLPDSPIPSLHTVELSADRAPELQRFFDANPDYFLICYGEPAGPNEAHEEIEAELPTGWSFSKKWMIGYVDDDGELAAMANVVTDLLAPGVWHIGTFMVDSARHGNGDAQALYAGLETWARQHHARWLRLGVVRGNVRAERFWAARGFVEMRTREAVEMGRLIQTLRVMAKPLRGESFAHYLALIPRDQPE